MSNGKYFARQTFANHENFENFLRKFLGNMGLYDTKNWKREIRKTLQDKLFQMDDFEFFARQTFAKKEKISKICEHFSD